MNDSFLILIRMGKTNLLTEEHLAWIGHEDKPLTVEISQRDIIEMAADRAKYIDQSQSMNLYFEGGTYGKISGALRYAWQQGLKTGVYYVKTEKKTDKPKRLTQMESDTKTSNGDFECFGCSS